MSLNAQNRFPWQGTTTGNDCPSSPKVLDDRRQRKYNQNVVHEHLKAAPGRHWEKKVMALFSYIDPGTGAIIMQVIAASIFGIGIFFRRLGRAPFRFAAKLFSRKPLSDGEASD